MHPEIRKFWEKKFPIGSVKLGNTQIYFVSSGNTKIFMGDLLSTHDDIIYMESKTKTLPFKPYKVNDKWYSEQEMLKLIKLKSFW